jgi:hypothetical protein
MHLAAVSQWLEQQHAAPAMTKVQLLRALDRLHREDQAAEQSDLLTLHAIA